MDICSSGHDEVVYSSRSCPACDALQNAKDREAELKDEISALTCKIDDMQEELDSIQEPLIAAIKAINAA